MSDLPDFSSERGSLVFLANSRREEEHYRFLYAVRAKGGGGGTRVRDWVVAGVSIGCIDVLK